MIGRSYVIIYGRGGHQAQMSRLLDLDLFKSEDKINLIAMTDSNRSISKRINQSYCFDEFRNKHSNLLTFLFLPWTTIQLIFYTFLILIKYKVSGVVVTGPGIAIIPCVIFRLLGKKTVVFESWSKFKEASYTAKILYQFSGLFVIQSKTLKKIFPKSSYFGKL